MSAKNSGESFAEKILDKALFGGNQTHKPSRASNGYSVLTEWKKQTNAKIAPAGAMERRKSLSSTTDGNVPYAYWNRNNRQANLNRNNPRNRDDNYGVRGAARDYALFKDFIQPPSILPISASLLCV